MVLEAVTAQLSAAVRDITTSRYLCAVALVLSIYDWIILVADESRTVWQGHWTLPKGIYYFNRIITVAGLFSASYQLSDLRHGILSTKIYIFVNSLVELFSFFLANWLLTLRLVALYKRNKPLAWFLYTFLIISYMITAFFMIYTLHKYSLAIHYSTIAHACASTTSSNLMPAVFLAPAAFEFTLFTLTGYRAWQDVKLVTSRSSAPFLVVLYRDGIICFFVMFGVRIWNVWIYATQPITSAYLGIYLLWATMTILSTRVYLNLQFLTRGSRTDTESDFTIGAPQFAVPANPGMTTTNAIFANITQGDFPHSICLQERSSHSPGSPINNARATFLSLSDTETSRSNDRLESPSRTFGHRPFSTISLSFASMPSSNA